MSDIQLIQGDCLELMKEIPDGSVDAAYGSGLTQQHDVIQQVYGRK